MESPSVAVIVGDSPTLIDNTFNFDNYEHYDYTVFAVNNGGFRWMNLTCTVPEYWYSYHEEWFDKVPVPFESKWLSCKQESYQELKPRYRSWHNITFLDIPTAHGSSGFHAANIAIDHFNFSKVVLIGVSIENEYAPWINPFREYKRIYGKTWKEARPIFYERVRSMDGYTRELLGAPTKSWLQGE